MKNKFLMFLLIIPICFIYSCQTVKDAVQGKKRSKTADEFLVEKKNPLIMPPNYGDLPKPGENKNETPKTSDAKEDVKDILNLKTENQNNKLSDKQIDIEQSILEKISDN